MNAAQIAGLLTKALNRDVICIEHHVGIFIMFLSEKEKTAYLASPSDHEPAAQIIGSEGNFHWKYVGVTGEVWQSDKPLDTFKECLYELAVNWFSGYFLAGSFSGTS